MPETRLKSAGGTNELEPPNTTLVDLLFSGAKAGVSAIPIFGGALAEGIGYVGQRIVVDRQARFLEAVLNRLSEACRRIDNLESSIMQNESFYSSLAYALSGLSYTTEREKIDALRNAVVNSALPTAPDEALQHTFIRYVHELTAWHLMLLDCIRDPLAWAKKRDYPVHDPSISPAALFEGVTRGQLQPPDFHKTVLQDLLSRGLATTGVDPYGLLIVRNEAVPRITDLGTQFLAFITPPRLDTDTSISSDVFD